ncbi:MAG TPA: YceI family protein [Chthoniobacterales bacterium]|nr:YceI family protein [Chthoniobacterales bacterium]
MAKSGKIAFVVGSNIPLLKVTGSSTAVTGGGDGTLNGETATVLNLRFEVDPKTFKTGMKLRDDHMYEKVFTASDGSVPRLVLRAERLQARLNPKTSKWEGELKGQLTMRGVTKPVSFSATAEKKGDGAVVSAQGSVKTSAFGVEPIRYAGAQVQDEVAVTVSNVVITPAAR